VLNKVTLFHLSVQSQFLTVFPYINYQFYPRGIPFILAKETEIGCEALVPSLAKHTASVSIELVF
jgi:hypothetical protein